MSAHGTAARYNAGCRCPDCRGAYSKYHWARQWERAGRRRLVDGRLVATEAAVHGSANTYTNWMCRCEPCTTAQRERMRQYKRRYRRAAS